MKRNILVLILCVLLLYTGRVHAEEFVDGSSAVLTSSDINTLAELNAIVADATLLDDGAIADSTAIGLNTGATYTFGDSADDSLNELFDAVDTAIDLKLTTSGAAAAIHLDDALTTIGVASEATHMGTFTGSTITDNITAKAGIQLLETSLETKLATSGTGASLTAVCLESVFGTAIGTGLTLDSTTLKASTILQKYHGVDPSADVLSVLGAANEAAILTFLDLEAGTDFYSMSAADTAFEAEITNSSGLRDALSDETGTGLSVFATSPILTTSFLMVNGFDINLSTTTDQHEYSLRAYDVDGTAWTDMLNIKNANAPLATALGTWDFTGATVSFGPLSIFTTTSGDQTRTVGQLGLKTDEDYLVTHGGANGQVTTEVAIPLFIDRSWSFDPDAICDLTTDRLPLMTVDHPHGIKILEWRLTFDVDPTTEFGAGETLLKRATAFIGVGSTATVDDLATTAGVASETTEANINANAIVANGQVLYIDFPTAYTEALHSVMFEMRYQIEED